MPNYLVVKAVLKHEMRTFLKPREVFGPGVEDRTARNRPGTLRKEMSVAQPAASYDNGETSSLAKLTEQLFWLFSHASIDKDEVKGFAGVEALIERAMMNRNLLDIRCFQALPHVFRERFGNLQGFNFSANLSQHRCRVARRPANIERMIRL